MKKNYVVGGSGLLGSEIVRQIDNSLFKVVVLDIKKNLKQNPNVYFHKLDCTKLGLVKKKLLIVLKNSVSQMF